MVSPGDRGLPALLGALPVRAGTDHEDRVSGLRGGHCAELGLVALTTGAFGRVAAMSLLDKAEQCLAMSQELLFQGDNAGSIVYALEAAKYLQLIRLFREMDDLGGLPR